MSLTLNGNGTIGGVAGGLQVPAFMAHNNGAAQSLTAATSTKIQFGTKNYDTASCFDNVTNHRFTPNVAGYYLVAASVGVANNATTYYADCYIMKNGVNFTLLFGGGGNGSSYFRGSGSTIVYCNGTTDYIEVNCNCSVATTTSNCTFSAVLVRSA